MSMIERLQPILALLDEGIALYRRNFAPLVLISAVCVVPFALLVGVAVLVATRVDETSLGLLVLALALLALPVAVYLVGGLSRAAAAAIAGQPVSVRAALGIRPLRLLGMGCFTLIYSILAQIVTSLLSMICICPLYIVGFGVIAGVGSLSSGGGALGAVFGALVALIFSGVYVVALVIGGATYSSLIYALQPWVQESLAFGVALQRSLDLVLYRFGRNLIIWGLAALIIAAVGLSVTLAVGVLVPLPLVYVLGSESPVARAVSATAWMIGLVLVLPPLPCWMALLYRRNLAEREGLALDAQVQAWWRSSFGAAGAERPPINALPGQSRAP